MSFGGGGGGALPNHEHTNIPLDGGPLDFVNTTIASMNAGSTTFSDGNALQELVIGTPAQQLKVNAGATAPEWFTPAAAGASTAQYIQTSGHFTTTSTSLVSITNYVVTLPTTTAASDDCLCLLSYAVTISGGSDAILLALTKDTTVLINQTVAPPVLDENTVGAFQFITDADGDQLYAQTSTAGGNTMTFRIYAGNNPCLSAFAV